MRVTQLALVLAVCSLSPPAVLRVDVSAAAATSRYPAHRASNVAPDTHLVLTFAAPPQVGASGRIQVFDAVTRALVDTLDLAIPAGPPPGAAAADAAIRPPGAVTAPRFQQTVIGGFAEGFHFYPVIARGNTATIYLHNNVLAYGRTYEVQIDPGAIIAPGFDGIPRGAWTFRTRERPPSLERGRLVVGADGTGDFDTVQGAVDAIPSDTPGRVTVFIKRGRYEEIVYFRNKRDITFAGEDREGVLLCYANNERFNGPPAGVRTNELPGTFPYRRAVFHAARSTGIEIVNLTIENLTPFGGSQAEALLLSGGRNLVRRATLRSHQDTVQFNDSVYVEDSFIAGDVDFVWGRGPAFFRNTVLREQSAGPFMWVRSTSASHGFVFDRCRFETAPGATPYLARNTENYPDSEIVLLESALGDINPAAWQLPADPGRVRYLEFASRQIADGAPAEVGSRHAASRQLDAVRDAETIASYRDPAFVLGGWQPRRN
jgi:pectinesterase